MSVLEKSSAVGGTLLSDAKILERFPLLRVCCVCAHVRPIIIMCPRINSANTSHRNCGGCSLFSMHTNYSMVNVKWTAYTHSQQVLDVARPKQEGRNQHHRVERNDRVVDEELEMIPKHMARLVQKRQQQNAADHADLHVVVVRTGRRRGHAGRGCGCRHVTGGCVHIVAYFGVEMRWGGLAFYAHTSVMSRGLWCSECSCTKTRSAYFSVLRVCDSTLDDTWVCDAHTHLNTKTHTAVRQIANSRARVSTKQKHTQNTLQRSSGTPENQFSCTLSASRFVQTPFRLCVCCDCAPPRNRMYV